ncbi:hypothetical protein BJ878DRAFT_418395, partial [Calycina marina]
SPSRTEFLKWFREHDWASTSLDALEGWSPNLQRNCELQLADPQPAALFWGPDYLLLYNEAYLTFLGGRGLSIYEVFPGTLDDIRSLYDQVATHGKGLVIDDTPFELNRHGFLEQLYIGVTLIPLHGDAGYTATRRYNSCRETRQKSYSEQRLSTLLKLAHPLSHNLGLQDYWNYLVKGLLSSGGDIPLALVYHTTADISERPSSTTFNSLTPTRSKLADDSDEKHGFPDYLSEEDATRLFLEFQRLLTKNEPMFLDSAAHNLSDKLLHHFKRSNPGKHCTSAAFVPLKPMGMQAIVGFIIISLNPKRPYNGEYYKFLQLLQRQIAPNLTAAITHDSEVKRDQLREVSANKTLEYLNESLNFNLHENERLDERHERFVRLIEMSTVSMFDFDPDGKLMQANVSVCLIDMGPLTVNRISGSKSSLLRRPSSIHVALLPILLTPEWLASNTIYLQCYNPYSAMSGHRQLDDASPVFLSYVSVGGSRIFPKHALQKQETAEALELKRQQEKFIDMTSHELRNPLSAVLQCSDAIMEILSELEIIVRGAGLITPKQLDSMSQFITEGIDATRTIIACSNHSSRIIEDTLTLSKLDSKLLAISPVSIDPKNMLKDLQSMFLVEAERANIRLEIVSDPSLHILNTTNIMFDPSRTLQVLINLITNAIKFTKNEDGESKRVSVTMSISKERPTGSPGRPDSDILYNSSQLLRDDITSDLEWEIGESLFLSFVVEDTGRGVAPNEQLQLFSRFTQANQRTHISYGGSGLGLFTSRELTEMQGGEVGLASKLGVGSKLAFYIKCRRNTDAAALVPAPSPIRDTLALIAEVSPISILVVEDNLVNQKILCKQLKGLGCKVVGAGHGQEALDHINTTTIAGGSEALDCILMDVEMPIMDGLTCTWRIRELEAQGVLKGHVPIIGTSANACTEQNAESMAAGMDESISKPFRMGELVSKIVTLLKSSRHSTQNQVEKKMF